MSESFQVKTPVFEGPLELLLQLIEKRKLLINDIALSKVADEYMEYVQRLDEFPVKDVTQFVLVASTLVLIKSKSLLPEFSLTSEEEESILDLEDRLKAYKRAQELSKNISKLFGKKILFTQQATPMSNNPVFAPHKGITVQNLFASVQSLLAHLPKKEQIKKAVVEKIMSLEDMMQTLSQRITNAMSMKFSEFSKTHKKDSATPREEKVNTIVGFLAMLELVKQGILAVKQHASFSDIEMESENVGTPSYT